MASHYRSLNPHCTVQIFVPINVCMFCGAIDPYCLCGFYTLNGPRFLSPSFFGLWVLRLCCDVK